LTIAAVTFDVTHTLLACPRLGEIYSQTLARHGITVPAAEAARVVSEVWQEFACAARPDRDRFGAHPEGSRGWWRDFLIRFCEHIEAPAPSRFAAAELYQNFARGEAWEVYPEVPAVLDGLRARGLRLGVISNWDERLPGILAERDLARRFDVVVVSSAVGVEKPDARIFTAALAALGVPAAAVLHVGDRQLEDAEGAAAVGMRSLLVPRRPWQPAAGARRAADLLDAILAAGSGPPPEAPGS
jgi:putative hydrolase of the HAD superfamily